MKLTTKVAFSYLLVTLTSGCFLFKKKQTPSNDLHIAWESAPRSIDPRFATDANSQYLSDLINCSLIRFDQTGKVSPSLAKSWKWTTSTSLSVNIRKGVLFSDGTPVSIDDILASYQFALTGKDSPFTQTFKSIDKIGSQGQQIVFDFKEPDATFLTNLTIGILPEKMVTNDRIQEPKNHIGCGAFTLEAMSMSQLKLTPNTNYKLGTTPKVDAIYFDIVKDETTRFSKLRKGEIDLVQKSISRDKIKKAQEEYADLKVKKSAGLNTTYIAFNMKDKVVSKAKVRQALAYAVDRSVIIKHVLAGFATPANSMLPASDSYHLGSIPLVEQDLDKAKKLLKEALGKDLSKINFKISTTTDLTRVTIAKTIASQLQKLGVNATVQSLEWGKFKEDVDKGNLQMWLLSWIGFKDPDILRYTFATESFPPNGGNRGFYSNKKLDALLTKAKSEVDADKRKQLYQTAQSIVHEEMPYLFLWHEDNFAIFNKKVQGFDIYPDGRYSALEKVQIAQ